jgi:hypothetical protein
MQGHHYLPVKIVGMQGTNNGLAIISVGPEADRLVDEKDVGVCVPRLRMENSFIGIIIDFARPGHKSLESSPLAVSGYLPSSIKSPTVDGPPGPRKLGPASNSYNYRTSDSPPFVQNITSSLSRSFLLSKKRKNRCQASMSMYPVCADREANYYFGILESGCIPDGLIWSHRRSAFSRSAHQ